ncbi:MAG TPA: hypothetical protein VFN26_13830 [Candidatus Acidoferrum sp.]|nr:hypothetical protein [Candidatus Acidoferrum sp.]
MLISAPHTPDPSLTARLQIVNIERAQNVLYFKACAEENHLLACLCTGDRCVTNEESSDCGKLFWTTMNVPPPICLTFDVKVPELQRARISYAFRVFSAIYNYRVVNDNAEEAAIRIEYGEKASSVSRSRCFHIPALYRARSLQDPPNKPLNLRYSDEDVFLFYGIDGVSGKPDWLGEIFEWISSIHESSVTNRDSAGRIPSRYFFETFGISPRKPHATLLMAWMENALKNGHNKEALSKAPSPIAGAEHIVVCSQDVDFYNVDKFSAGFRLIKNMAIAVRPYRSWSFLHSNSNLFLDLLRGRRVGDYLPELLARMERHELQSTIFMVARQGHRRDPNYRLQALAPYLSEVSKQGSSVALHSSYTSIVEDGTLIPELQAFEKATGKKPMGNRQHWLRFDDHKKLFDAVEGAGLSFDSSLGFTEIVGFRNGASFAFPPYDFEGERPYHFLEIPLVVMDVNLEAESRKQKKDAQGLADEVLGESRKWSWGGISVLWHNPIEHLQVPKEINQVFWNCAPRPQSGEKWMSGEHFVNQCLSRYQNAGLLEGVQTSA